jgi:hypothetical protein
MQHCRDVAMFWTADAADSSGGTGTRAGHDHTHLRCLPLCVEQL